jgi:hypothetical protein
MLTFYRKYISFQIENKRNSSKKIQEMIKKERIIV